MSRIDQQPRIRSRYCPSICNCGHLKWMKPNPRAAAPADAKPSAPRALRAPACRFRTSRARFPTTKSSTQTAWRSSSATPTPSSRKSASNFAAIRSRSSSGSRPGRRCRASACALRAACAAAWCRPRRRASSCSMRAIPSAMSTSAAALPCLRPPMVRHSSAVSTKAVATARSRTSATS